MSCLLPTASLIGALAMPSLAGRFEDLGIPVRKTGLMGAIVGPDENGETTKLHFDFNQNGASPFLVQKDAHLFAWDPVKRETDTGICSGSGVRLMRYVW